MTAISVHRFLLRELDGPSQLFANITPNWFASVMGTGIVAVAAATLPAQFSGLRTAATVVWSLAVVVLVVLLVATALHWARHPATARSHALHPVMSHFYGAPPMAMLTVGAATILLGKDVIGLRAAVDIDWVLWMAGTVAGLLSATVIPYLLISRRRLTRSGAFGGWLMPVVPPMVSASTGALLVPHAPAGGARVALLLACYAMFGLAVLASLIVTVEIGRGLLRHGVGEARTVPTLWIVLGPLGQSITAANLLGAAAVGVLPRQEAATLTTFGLAYGIPVWSLAVAWIAVAATVTMRTARDGLPFSLTWWSFTFPVGTMVTGTTALAVHSGVALFRVVAVLLYAALVCAWLLVAARTAHGCLCGRLFLPPATATAITPAGRAVAAG